jgi:hypothetical protein
MTQAIIELCGGEDGDPLSEYWDWVLEFIARADAIIDLEPQDTTQRMEAARQFAKEERELASKKRFAIFRDVYTEELWLPAGALLECSGSKKTPRQFASDLAEIGWRHWPVDWRGRGGREAREQGEVDRFQRAFYIGLT